LNQIDNICTRSPNYVSILHIDRLQITLKHSSSSIFKNYWNPDLVPQEQVYGKISLFLDNSKGASAYHHTFNVFCEGLKIGKLHTANKMRKPEIEFDIDKEVLYSIDEKWWYKAYDSVKEELGLVFNNINYVEIALDTTKNLVEEYRSLYFCTVNNMCSINNYYKMSGNAVVDILDNGNTFNIRGTCNFISIYEKTRHAENYILDFFKSNGFGDCPVFRVEARLNWNYLKSKMHNKNVLINLETLLDRKMLATLFKMSVENKLIFSDLRTKSYDSNRNIKFQKVAILSDIHLDTAGLLKYNPELRNQHYKSENSDENILRQNFYRFLETDKQEYFRIFKANGKVAGLDDRQLLSLIEKFNSRYKGNRTATVQSRMDYAVRWYSKRPKLDLNNVWSAIAFKMKLMFFW